MLLPLLFAIVVDVITENAKRGVVNELLYADDLVIMSKDMEDLKERFWNWMDALESKGLKVNTRKTKLMVSGSEGKLFKSKIDPCGVCGRRVMANSVLCTKCTKRGRTKLQISKHSSYIKQPESHTSVGARCQATESKLIKKVKKKTKRCWHGSSMKCEARHATTLYICINICILNFITILLHFWGFRSWSQPIFANSDS